MSFNRRMEAAHLRDSSSPSTPSATPPTVPHRPLRATSQNTSTRRSPAPPRARLHPRSVDDRRRRNAWDLYSRLSPCSFIPKSSGSTGVSATKRSKWIYPFRSLFEAGLRSQGPRTHRLKRLTSCTASSACVTREGFETQECISAAEAVRLYTINAPTPSSRKTRREA